MEITEPWLRGERVRHPPYRSDEGIDVKYVLIWIMGAIAAIGWLKPKVVPRWLNVLVVLLITIVAVIQTVAATRESREKEAQRFVGKLESPTSHIFFARKRPPQLEFGDSGAIFIYEGPEGASLFSIFEDNSLTIWTETSQIKISTILKNRKGEVIAQLQANEWIIKKEKAFDRNFTADALEVIDETGDVVLQVRVKEDRIQFQGKFYDSTGRGVAFGKVCGPQGVGGGIEFTRPDHPQLKLKIEPIFKYPSELHLGELLGQEKPSLPCEKEGRTRELSKMSVGSLPLA